MSLEPNTLETMILATSVAMVVTLAVVAAGHRVPGLWSLAGSVLCLGLTFLLYRLHPFVPALLLFALTSGVPSLALSLLLLAVLQLRGQSLHVLWLAAPPLIALLSAPLLARHAAAASATSDALSTLQLCLVLWVLVRDGGIGVGRGRHILAASVVALILLCGTRSVTVALGLLPAPPPNLSGAPLDTMTYLALHLTMVFSTLGFVLAAAEITADEHHQLAMQDALTGLPNRRAVLDQLLRHWSAAVRAQRPLAVLVIDIDRFKTINDDHGHATGDAVLRRVAKLLRMRVRAHDMVGRFGGEEFLVVLPDTESDSALALAQALRTKIASVPVRAKGKLLPVTISVGLHGLRPTTSDKAEDLIQRADAALYQAKAAGRNRVVSA